MRQIQGSGGGGGCFPAGVRIATPYGHIAIEDVRLGHLVLAVDSSGQIVRRPVTALYTHSFGEVGYTSPLLIIAHTRGVLRVTGNHYIRTPSRQGVDIEPGFCQADELVVGDTLYYEDSSEVIILSIRNGAEYDYVYNFEVADVHTYIADDIQVHNGGGGGKGDSSGSGRVAVEDPDSLRSRQYARILDIVAEGEIVGLVNGLKDVYLDDTPVQNPDGSYNFVGITLDSRTGTQGQTHIPGFTSVESETAVGVRVTAGVPVVRSISNLNIDAIRVTISVPNLSSQNTTNGDISGTSVAIQIERQTNGGGYSTVVSDTISGKTTSRYQRSYRIELTGTGPWDIRVNRSTADSSTQALQNQTYWDSYTEIIDSKLTYPNTALIGMSVDAERFRAIPRRGYKLKGLIVRVPSNYNAETRIYTGVWDGNFILAYTNNPAWCYYDMLTNDRYGLGGDLSEAQIDKWALYQIGVYCDELVDNGFGGLESRFTCNLYLQTQDEAYNVLSAMASVFCGMTYWAGGAVVATQDSPASPTGLFNPANTVIKDGLHFSYSGSSVKARHTVALVTWNDPSDRYRSKVEYVEDTEGVARYGVRQTPVVAVGCTSRGQAHRFGRRILYAERLETEVITFRVGLDGLATAPGEIIQTTDPLRAGARLGGRVVSATTTVVTLDADVTIELGKTYTLLAVLPDQTVESRDVVTTPATTSILQVSAPFTAAPQDEAIWVLSVNDLVPEAWRVLSVNEVEETQAEVVALEYRSDKYDALESDLILEPLSTSSISTSQATPTSLVIEESQYLITPSIVGIRLTVSWLGTGQYYELQYRLTTGNWQTISTNTSSVDIQPVVEGTYEFVLVALNTAGIRSLPATATKTVYGKTLRPVDVSNLHLAAISGLAVLTFDSSPQSDLDVQVGGYLRLRHTPLFTGQSWSNAVDIGPQVAGTATNATRPLVSGTYLAKWVDSNGNESLNATSVITDAPSVISMNVVATRTEHSAFTGTKTSVAKLGNDLTLDSAETIGEQLGLVSTWPKLSLLGGVATEGTYLFSSGIDLGSVQTSRVTASLMSSGFDALDLISDRGLVSLWTTVGGDVIGDVGCTIYVRTTNDDPSGSPTWSAWQVLVVGDQTCRAFEFKAVLYSNFSSHNLLLSQLEVSVDMPDRTEAGNDLVSGAGTYAVNYLIPFMENPAVSITAQNMATGDYYVITGKDETGFDITFRNSAAAAISRTFDHISKGF